MNKNEKQENTILPEYDQNKIENKIVERDIIDTTETLIV